jgi:hypothetical protein
MPIHGFGDCNLPFDVAVSSPNVISAIVQSSLASPSESAQVSVPVIWDQGNDSYYEPDPNGGNFYRYAASGSQLYNHIFVNSSLLYYQTQPDLTYQSYIKVANVFYDKSVNYYIQFDYSTYRIGGGSDNPSIGYIAGRWETISCTFSSNATTSTTYSYALSSTKNSASQIVTYTQSTATSTHNLITGNSVRCTNPGTTGLILNRIYYIINEGGTNSSSLKLSDSYENALAGVSLTLTNGTAEFKRQSGWIRIHEGTKYCGNGGDPVTTTNGTGNYWIRNPYNITTKTKSLLPTYNSTAVYSKGDRVISDNKVWECLSSQNSSNAVAPAVSAVEADLTGAHGLVMTEIPEMYLRRDHFDGVTWKNIKGADVSKDYSLMSGNNSLARQLNLLSSGVERDVHFMWVIHKSQFNNLSPAEQSKYLKHPAFMEPSDSESTRTHRLSADEAGQYFPDGIDVYYGSGTTIYMNFSHNWVVGKSLFYTRYPSVDGVYTGLSGLSPNTIYYITSAGSSTISVATSKSGTPITVSGSSFLGRFHGYFNPIVTKNSQQVTSVSTTLNSPAVFTTSSDHQLMVGQKVQLFFTGTIPNFTSGSFYYVLSPNYTNYTLSLATTLSNSLSNTAVNLTGTSSFTDCYLKPYVVDNLDNPLIEFNSISSTDTLNVDWVPGYNNHWLKTGDTVIYTGQITGLNSGSRYFVINVSPTSIKLASSYLNALSGTAIAVSGSVTSSWVVRANYAEVTYPGMDFPIQTINTDTPLSRNSYEVLYSSVFMNEPEGRRLTATLSGSTFTTPQNHNLFNGERVFFYFTGGTITGLTDGSAYHIVNVGSNTFQLSATLNGAAITTISITGSPSIYFYTLKPVSRKTVGSTSSERLEPGSVGVWEVTTIDGVPHLKRAKAGAEHSWLGGLYDSSYITGNMVYFNRYNGTVSVGTTSYSIASVSSNFISVGVNPNYVVNDQIINFVSVGGLTGVSINTNYKVVNKQADGTFKINDMNGNAVSVTSSGTITASIQSSIFRELKEQFYFINAKGTPDYYFTLHNTYEDALNNANPITNISPQPRFSDSPYYSGNYSTYGQMYGCFIIPRVYYLSNSGTNLNGFHPLLFMANVYTNMLQYRYYNQLDLSLYSYFSPLSSLQNSPMVTLKLGEGIIHYTAITPSLPRGYGYSKGGTHSRLIYLRQRGFDIIIGRDKFTFTDDGGSTATKTGLYLTLDQSKPMTTTRVFTNDQYAYGSLNVISSRVQLGGAYLGNNEGSVAASPYLPLECSRYCF